MTGTTRRVLRTRGGRSAAVGLACLIVLLVGLLSQGFLSPSAPPAKLKAAPTAGSSGGPAFGVTDGSAPGRGASPTPTASGTAKQNVLGTLRSTLPDNPLNHLRGAAVHTVVLEVRSAGAIPVVGWLVPSGLADAYGTKHNVRNEWSLRQRAVGSGYLAAVFIQTGRSGMAVTCRVIVDGRTTDTQTAVGSFGRTVCLG